ncbi:MAG: hypothetical protein WCD89_00475 [Anaerocolumna sp.]
MSTIVRLIIVATLASGIKGIGRRYHSMAFFRLVRDEVPVMIVQIIIINIRRHAKNNPVVTPSAETPGNERIGIGLPGIVKESITITNIIRMAKFFNSFNNVMIGSLDAHRTVNNTTVRTTKSGISDAKLEDTLNKIMHNSFIRKSILWKMEFL